MDGQREAVLGLVVNPVAGLGGPLGEKGSDRAGIARRADASGLEGRSCPRATRAMTAAIRAHPVAVLTGEGALGQSAWPDAEVLDIGELTGTAADTVRLVEAMADRVDLILFVGGDGTARDVASANPKGVPILGVPAGVKMHSGVFARSPERAGQAGAAFLASSARRTEMVEILDIDEAERRAGRLSARLHTVARTPATIRARQSAKVGGGDLLAEVDAAIGRYVAEMDGETLYVLGPGTTMAALKARLGGGTLLGVDVAQGSRVIARDVDAATLRAMVAGPARIVLTVVGGQGFILGRGNQQIAADIIRAVGPGRIDVICNPAKLAALDPPELTVDTDDPTLDAALAGYWPIITGPGRRQVMRVVA